MFMLEEISLFLNSIQLNWNIIESIAVILSIIYVVLAVKANIWCWFFSAISVILYIYICVSAQLYAETGLQIFYLLMTIYGYYNWSLIKKKTEIHQWSYSKHLIAILTGAFLTFLIGFWLTTYTEAKEPIRDSFTTVFSIIATYLVTRKVLENWLYWIVIDIVSFQLYLSRDLHLSSLLFIVYTIIAVIGYFSWTNKITPYD